MKKGLLKSSLLITLIFVTLLFSSCSYLLGNITTNTSTNTNSDAPVSITGTFINEYGELIINYSNGKSDNLGVVVGQDGKDGKDGVDGIDGIDGVDGKDGLDGTDGKDGANIITSNDTPLSLAVASCIQSSVIVQCGVRDAETLEIEGYSSGAGIIYSCNKSTGDAIIVTNYHVVYNVDNITTNLISDDINIYLYGATTSEQAIKATYIGGSMNYDLAVLQISNSDMIKNHEVKPVSFRDSGEVHVGDYAIAIGNPQSKGFSVTSGIVSVDSENITMTASDETTEITMRVMRIDTPVNSGNSGGGLFDNQGNLIGIVNAKIIENGIDNIGYAIPSSTAKAIIENILYYCQDTSVETVRRALLGVTVTVTDPYSVYNSETGYVDLYENCTVYAVPLTGLAFGKLQVGDIIKEVRISGSTEMSAEITRQYKMLDILLYARAGDVVTLTVERDGTLLDVEFTITSDCIVNS